MYNFLFGIVTYLLTEQFIKDNENVLIRSLDCNVNFLERLSSEDILDDESLQEIKAETTLLDKNKKLLQILSECPQESYDKFVEILKEEKQGHVANLLLGNFEGLLYEFLLLLTINIVGLRSELNGKFFQPSVTLKSKWLILPQARPEKETRTIAMRPMPGSRLGGRQKYYRLTSLNCNSTQGLAIACP